MNGKETMVCIAKWRLDGILRDANEILTKAARTVGSTIAVIDHPDCPETRDFALKDAARCYSELEAYIEDLKTDFADTEEQVNNPLLSKGGEL